MEEINAKLVRLCSTKHINSNGTFPFGLIRGLFKKDNMKLLGLITRLNNVYNDNDASSSGSLLRWSCSCTPLNSCCRRCRSFDLIDFAFFCH